MIIHFELYKETGKWYAGGDVEIPDSIPIYETWLIYDAICKKQTEVMEPRNFHMAITNKDPNGSFVDRLYLIDQQRKGMYENM